MTEPCKVRGILRSVEVDTVEVSAIGGPESYVASGVPQATIDFGRLGELRVDLHRLGDGVEVGDLFIATVEPQR